MTGAGRAGRRVDAADVLVVGAGPAGALTAARLAAAGLEVLVVERAPEWRWRAGGVFTSPAAVTELRRAGLDERTLRAVARPLPAMRVETGAGTTFRLTYGGRDENGPTGDSPHAPRDGPVGLDRSRLDPALGERAVRSGAAVWRGATCGGPFERDAAGAWRVPVRVGGEERAVTARVLVGADGVRSTVARQLGVTRDPRLADRVGLTFHLRDAAGDPARDARMVLLRDAYCGIAPVPGGRVNIGIVLTGDDWRRRLAELGAAAVCADVLRRVPSPPGEPEPWRDGEVLDAIEGAAPLGHRVTRRAGPGWLLVGDAAGFLDPFTGEGLHRALVSARLGARAVEQHLAGRPGALDEYDGAMRRRFAAKDLVSRIVLAFLARPMLFEYAARRLAGRDDVRATMGLVMGDLVPASRAVDPRFLAALLAP